MEGQKNLQFGRFLGQIGNDGANLATGDVFNSQSNVIRVAAIEDSYICNNNRGIGEEEAGIFLPAKVVEYFKVDINDEIELISGSVNISSIY